MQKETVQFHGYPIKPEHLDIGNGITSTFSSPAIDELVTAIIEYSQHSQPLVRWNDFTIADLNKILEQKGSKLRADHWMMHRMIHGGWVNAKTFYGEATYIPSHQLITTLFLKYPNDTIIHESIWMLEPASARSIVQ